jgi:hypothetical protein
MERNWLIRTSQNQILGPVAKSKLLEFIQKGALGLTDEVASGNGYWFSLKEKDLVEKYLYGDIPQAYNPISESKSILARRDNPDKTSSINNTPTNKTQVIKISDMGLGVTPKSEDLKFPDIGTPGKSGMPILNLDENEGLKLPTNDDLEFPDVNAITKNVSQTFQQPTSGQLSPVIHIESSTNVPPEAFTNSNEIVLPADDDLAFPDMNTSDKTSTKVEKGKVDLDQHYTRTVALDIEQLEKLIPVSTGANDEKNIKSNLDETALILEKSLRASPKVESAPLQKKERLQSHSTQADGKLLHDRKTKLSAKPAAQRDPSREAAHKDDQAGPLKKRNDNYIFFILIILILIIVAVFFYFKEILNKPLPV